MADLKGDHTWCLYCRLGEHATCEGLAMPFCECRREQLIHAAILGDVEGSRERIAALVEKAVAPHVLPAPAEGQSPLW